MFIDTHAHLYGEEFDADRDDVIRRALAAGAEQIILPNVDEASIEPMQRLCDAYPDLCLPTMGLQPEELPADPRPLLDKMEQLLATGRYAAVGEVGVDLYWDASRREEQLAVFDREIRWAVRFDLPLLIHAPAAHREIVDALTPYAKSLCGGIFHCFAGTADEACELLGFSRFYLGIGGIVTFKKSTLPDVLRAAVPLDRIVVETDAPYMAPVPQRGKRNESAFIPYIIDKLAEVYETTPERVAAITTANARRLFRLASPA